MAEQDNVWHPELNAWVDEATGNRMTPVDKGGDGVWRNPQGQEYRNGQWVNPQTTGVSGANNLSVTTPVGYQYEIQAREAAVQKYTADLNARAQKEITDANNAHAARMQQLDAQLQRELQAGRIDSDQYMQERELKQRESEFARDLALRQIQENHKYEIDKANTEIQRLAEMRQERELQAQLEANPTDFVASQYYKRMLGSPQAWDTAQQMASNGVAGQGAEGNPTVGTNPGDQNLLGQNYAPAAPAYNNSTLQNLAASIFSGNGNAEWNPGLSGTGAFGANIASPNSIGRAQAGQMSDQDLGILQSFLKAGVEVAPGGPRVGIDPNEWFKQMQNSWIGTIEDVGQQTQYA